MSNLHNSGSPATAGPRRTHPVEGGGLLWKAKSMLKWLAPFAWSVLGIAAMTWLSLRLGLNIPTGGFLYLIMVVFSAASGGFWSGTLTSIVAAVCLDFFFVPPIFHFDVDDPMDWVALGAFEFTS